MQAGARVAGKEESILLLGRPTLMVPSRGQVDGSTGDPIRQCRSYPRLAQGGPLLANLCQDRSSCAKLAKQMLEAGTELDIELTKRLEHPDATANRLTLALPASDETQGDRGFRWRPWKRQMNNRKGLVKLSANSVQWLQTMKGCRQ